MQTTSNSSNRRRRRHKRNDSNKIPNGSLVSSISGLPEEVVKFAGLKGFNTNEIAKAVHTLFESDGAYDDPQAVVDFLEGKTQPEKTPVNEPTEQEDQSAAAATGSSTRMNTDTHSNADESYDKSRSASRKSSVTSHSESNSTSEEQLLHTSGDVKQKEQAPQMSEEARINALEQAARSPQVGAAIRGFIMWREAAPAEHIESFFKSKALTFLFENVMRQVSSETVIRQLDSLLALLLLPSDTPQSELAQVRGPANTFTKCLQACASEFCTSLNGGDVSFADNVATAISSLAESLSDRFRKVRDSLGIACNVSSVLNQEDKALKTAMLEVNAANGEGLRPLLQKRDALLTAVSACERKAHAVQLSNHGTDSVDKISFDDSKLVAALEKVGSANDSSKLASEAEQALNSLNTEIENVFRPISQEQIEIQKQIAELAARKRELQDQISSINSQLQELSSSKQKLVERISVLEQQFKTRKTNLSAQFQGHMDAAIRSQLGARVKNTISTFEEQISQIISNTAAAATPKDTKHTLSARAQLVAFSASWMDADVALIVALEKRAEKSRVELSRLQAELDTYKRLQMTAVLKKVQDKMKRQASEIQEDIESVKGLKTHAEQKSSELRTALDTLKSLGDWSSNEAKDLSRLVKAAKSIYLTSFNGWSIPEVKEETTDNQESTIPTTSLSQNTSLKQTEVTTDASDGHQSSSNASQTATTTSSTNGAVDPSKISSSAASPSLAPKLVWAAHKPTKPKVSLRELREQ